MYTETVVFLAKGLRISDKSPDQDVKKKLAENGTKLCDLHLDCLEKIASYMDAGDNLNMLYSNKKIYSKLVGCAFFWKHLCELEGLDKVSSLCKEVNKDDNKDCVAWSGELLHSNETSEEATRWQKIYQRGVQMRRNLTAGKCEMWRLFMTYENCLPVRKMTQDTHSEDQAILHNLSPYLDQERQVRVNRYWNEEFLVLMRYDLKKTYHDIFVWKWHACQKPMFLYFQNLLPTYPSRILPMFCFIHQNFFIFMPDPVISKDQRMSTYMVRVHDLSDGFKLVGKFDFDEDSDVRRHRPHGDNEMAHLHQLGDKAVALCRTPELTVLIFSIPDCKLEKSFKIKDNLSASYEHLELDQRFMAKGNTMMFLFREPNFYASFWRIFPMKYGQLLHLDFHAYFHEKGEIRVTADPEFEVSLDYIEKTCLHSKTQVTCLLKSGKIVVKDITSHQNLLTIEATEPMRPTVHAELDIEVECDGPSISCGPGGDLIIAKRHFASGRKIHAYNKVGAMLYEISVDDPAYGLLPWPGLISVRLDGRFIRYLKPDDNLYFVGVQVTSWLPQISTRL